ncbi:hypothetical protein S245_024969, partial [Arachis hypogaea]
VANYCRERLHSALIEEIGAAQPNDEVRGIRAGNGRNNSGGPESTIEPIAHETAGSTTVVTILSQSHIIVTNCRDSRAVVYCEKQGIPLSADHKPNREDEWARIEAAGGRVIHWQGLYIGKGTEFLAFWQCQDPYYLKPCIIPELKVKFLQQEKHDECLILASDGLWDVVTNEEACEVAWKRILLWHNENDVCIFRVERHNEP